MSKQLLNSLHYFVLAMYIPELFLCKIYALAIQAIEISDRIYHLRYKPKNSFPCVLTYLCYRKFTQQPIVLMINYKP